MLKIENLTKSFGNMTAVDAVNFEVQSGEIMGLIGQNGAGKTTTFRMILDFLTPNQGQIFWNGQPLKGQDMSFIGYLPEERGLYPKMRLQDQISYFAQLHGMTKKEVNEVLPEWFERFEVKGKLRDKVKDLSKGNQQKVQLIAALIFHPKLIILDEPFSGLDPVNAGLLEDGIQMLKAEGSAIIFSSHDMGNVQALSDHLVMLRQGKVVLDGTVSQIRDSYGKTKIFLQSPLTKEELEATEGVLKVVEHDHQMELTLAAEEVGQEIFKMATANGYITEFRQEPPTLDEIFRLKVGEVDA